MTAVRSRGAPAFRLAVVVLTLAGLVLTSRPLSPPSGAQEQPADDRPVTIPALREWTARPGEFTFTESSRVVVRHADRARLRGDARRFARDLAAEVGSAAAIVTTRKHRVRPGDVLVELATSDDGLGREGYRLDVGDVLTISGPAPAGVFYGMQSVLQLAHHSARIPAGTARDWPRYAFRGFMLDNGRKYFTPGWIRARIREMAFLKLNTLHLHFSDNQGFRIESDQHPEVVSDEHLTKREVRQLINLAKRYHVTVVPEIDSPGHMEAALAEHPELQITDADGNRQPDKLNFIDPAARRFVRELLVEYLALFPGPWWHIGGDEFVFVEQQWSRYPQLTEWAERRYGEGANHYDAFFDYINWLDDLVTCGGRRSRMWSGHLGGEYVKLRPTITQEVWHRQSDFATPQELLDAGNPVLNAMYYPMYYVVSPHWYARPDNKVMADWYENWQPWEFDGDFKSVTPDTVEPTETRLTGTKLHVWADWPDFLDEATIGTDIAPRLRITAQKAWHSTSLTSRWTEFTALDDRVGPAPDVHPRVLAATARVARTARPVAVPRACASMATSTPR